LAEAFERPGLISAISKELLQKWIQRQVERTSRRRHDLEYRWMHNSMSSRPKRIDKDMALLALDLFPAS